MVASTYAFASNPYCNLNKALDSGKNVVVLFVSDEEANKYANSEDDGEIEFYSDWYTFLGDFLNDQGDKAVICKLSLAEGRRLFQSQGLPKNEWSIVFMKKGRRALYSADPIMEPGVFQFAAEYFDNKEDKKEAKNLGFSYITPHVD